MSSSIARRQRMQQQLIIYSTYIANQMFLVILRWVESALNTHARNHLMLPAVVALGTFQATKIRRRSAQVFRVQTATRWESEPDALYRLIQLQSSSFFFFFTLSTRNWSSAYIYRNILNVGRLNRHVLYVSFSILCCPMVVVCVMRAASGPGGAGSYW